MVIVASDLLHLPTIEALKEHRTAMMNSSVSRNVNGVKFEQTVRQDSRLRHRSQIDLKCVRACHPLMKLSLTPGIFLFLIINSEHFVYVLFNYKVAIALYLVLTVCKAGLYSNG